MNYVAYTTFDCSSLYQDLISVINEKCTQLRKLHFLSLKYPVYIGELAKLAQNNSIVDIKLPKQAPEACVKSVFDKIAENQKKHGVKVTNPLPQYLNFTLMPPVYKPVPSSAVALTEKENTVKRMKRSLSNLNF